MSMFWFNGQKKHGQKKHGQKKHDACKFNNFIYTDLFINV